MSLVSALTAREYSGSRDKFVKEMMTYSYPRFGYCGALKQKEIANNSCLFFITFHPRRPLLAAARANCTQIWNPNNGKLLANQICHEEVITTIEWIDSPDIQFYTASLDKTIKLWNDDKNVQTLVDHNDWIRSLCVSEKTQILLSGCVSSRICGWDISTAEQLFSIRDAHVHPNFTELNTITSLKFAHGSETVFLSGARDGCVKLWDTRADVNKGAVHLLSAHEKKVNVALFTKDNNQMLTAGRDNAIRLWDIRAFGDLDFPLSSVDAKPPSVIREYKGHVCDGYNVSSCFLGNEEYILTGSEDGSAYIYETSSGKCVKQLEGHSGILHLLDSQDDTTIATSSTEDCSIYLWRPDFNNDQVKTLPVRKPPKENHEELEKLLQKHGDQILSIFHKNNITLSPSHAPHITSTEEEFARAIEALTSIMQSEEASWSHQND